jgi:hypothetical protein
MELIKIGDLYVYPEHYVFLFSRVDGAIRAREKSINNPVRLAFAKWRAQELAEDFGETPMICEPYKNPCLILDVKFECIQVLSGNQKGWTPYYKSMNLIKIT